MSGIDGTDQHEGQHLIEHLALPGVSVLAWGAAGGRHARGWQLADTEVILDAGRPFGSLLYRRIDDGRTERVAVHWNNIHEQLHCFVVDLNASDHDRSRLELDARSRAAAFMAIHAEVGHAASRDPAAARDILAASHLLPDPPAAGV
jgi:hypothetical protein